MKFIFKLFSHKLAMLLVSPCACLSWLESRTNSRAEVVYRFWADFFSLMPGLPGAYLRRAYYCWCLESCSANCHIGFGVIFAHRRAIVEESVYLGTYALLGEVNLKRGCLIGSRCSIISGGTQHERNSDGEWTTPETQNFQRISIGKGAWLGEASVIVADVGEGAMVAAGAVVAAQVPMHIMVAGNPARFVKKLETEEHPGEQKPFTDEGSNVESSNLSQESRRGLIHD